MPEGRRNSSQGGIVTATALSVHVEEQGSGPAVLLLPGLFHPALSLAGTAAALAAAHRVLSVDPRGVGRAPLTGGGMADQVADIGAVLDAYDLDRAALVGHSLGAHAALRFAVAQPLRVRGLVLAGASALAESAQGAEVWGGLAQLIDALGLERVGPAIVAQLYAADSLERGVEGEPRLIEELREIPVESIKAQLAAVAERETVEDQLASIVVPTLIVQGDLDAAVSLANAQLLAELIPNAELALLDDVGHMSAIEQPQRFTALVTAFFEKHGL